VVFKTTQFSESVAYSEFSGVVVQDVQAYREVVKGNVNFLNFGKSPNHPRKKKFEKNLTN
jgi:hypothetical protein